MDQKQKIGHSCIQHGKENNRIYLLKYDDHDPFVLIQQLNGLCKKYNYGKIIAKIPEHVQVFFLQQGYTQEAFIPDFFKNGESVFFMSKYLDSARMNLESTGLDTLSGLLFTKSKIRNIQLQKNLKFRIAGPLDCEEMATLYQRVFETYPFPIFDSAYLRNTMETGEVIYFGIWQNGQLVALSSAELDEENKNAEMTDFAVLQEMRGENMAGFLLQKMEQEMLKMRYKTLYTIARLQSPGMNKTFIDQKYHFSGLLKNNTNISGTIENMTVYYKNLKC
ncbi:MAG: putative beta-lysine N-acetyltransferase [Bacteroidales bacterium]|nr:putative beta-lysine N-acetyltransferase [Bacteroidales bacterium]